MVLKPRYKRRIFWTIITAFALAALAVILVPPMITLNYLKPKLESAVIAQTGVPAQINGDIHFSLLGGVLIVAHDVSIPIGTINAAMFSVPMRAVFDMENTALADAIIIYDANLNIDKLEPQLFDQDIIIHSSHIRFMNKEYDIINGTLRNGKFTGLVRLGDHRYEIEFENDVFHIRNRNNKLDAVGQLYSDGSTRGQISLETDDVNGWFGFAQPKIKRTIKLTADFEWDGGRGLAFQNIQSTSFDGDIILYPDGNKDIRLRSDDMNFDFTFLMELNRIKYQTNFDLDFHGDLKFANHDFKHLRFKAIGTGQQIQIANIVADDITLTGGTIDAAGAHNVMITMPVDGMPAMCLFTGNEKKWKCSEFSYGDISGSLSVQNGEFEMFIQSDGPMPANFNRKRFARYGRTGRVNFQFSDIGGTLNITPAAESTTYTFAHNRTLDWMGIKLSFLPDFMLDDVGDFTWFGTQMNFIPKNGKWMLRVGGNEFAIAGTNIKEWFPGLDLRAMNDLPYTISGAYNGGNISNLKINIAGTEFTGTVRRGGITLKTELLNLDAFISQEYIDNYDEMEFLSMSPIMIPFELGATVSLSADRLIYNGNEYGNFAYSLKPDIQTFSITDSARGNLLAEIRRDKNKYYIGAKLNRFKIAGLLLNSDMPLNVRDTNITAEIEMSTWGQIAHDIEYNLTGEMDLSFDGGYIIGLGFDDFYASAENITTLNAKFALANALTGGETHLKKMRVIGIYKNGGFETTAPMKISMPHTDGAGNLHIAGGMMTAELAMVMRGTSPAPTPVELSLGNGGARNYSLSQIMTDFDPGYMRSFVKTHGKF